MVCSKCNTDVTTIFYDENGKVKYCTNCKPQDRQPNKEAVKLQYILDTVEAHVTIALNEIEHHNTNLCNPHKTISNLCESLNTIKKHIDRRWEK